MNPSRTLLRGLQVLEAVAAEAEPVGPTRIAEVVELDKATVGRLLYTLHTAGYLRSAGSTGRYVLTSKVLRMTSAETSHEHTRRVASPHLSQLRDETRETVHLGVIEQGRVVYIDKFDAPTPIRLASAIGQSNPINRTALGKAILAFLPPHRRDEVLDGAELVPPRGKDAFDRSAFVAELETVAKRGFATDDEENEEGVCCVGSAVVSFDGLPVAAVSISGPAYRMAPQTAELGRACRRVAQTISVEIGARLDHGSTHTRTTA